MNKQGLILKKVSKHINGLRLVNNVTASFLPGRITGLLGPNGAGKTTLFHLITGELRADCGTIVLSGESLAGLPPYRIARKGVGRLFQDVRIFENLSVFDNVASAIQYHDAETPWFPFLNRGRLRSFRGEIADKVSYWLIFTGLADMRDVAASSLSYGQQKLLALARLFAGDFSLLLLDEPTAGLSPLMVKKVLELLDKVVNEDNKKTIIIVEHNMGVISDIADWVFFMNEGKISFFGRTDHVLGDSEVREMYLGL